MADIEALRLEVAELWNPETCLMTHNERVLIELCHRLAAALPAAETTAAKALVKVRHVKRGSSYDVIGRGTLQSGSAVAEGERLVCYRGDDGQLWFRPEGDFDDGRFVSEVFDGTA